MAQANVGNSEQAAQGAQQELSEKTQLLEAAKNRVEQLLRQLSSARADLANTKQAAYKASAAAHEAKVIYFFFIFPKKYLRIYNNLICFFLYLG